MNENQFLDLRRHTFRLSDAALKAAKAANPEMAKALSRVRKMVETLPEDGNILREQAWQKMKPQLERILRPYSDKLGSDIINTLDNMAQSSIDYKARQYRSAGAAVSPPPPPPPGLLGAGVLGSGVNAKVNGKTVSQMFGLGSRQSPWTKSAINKIDKAVQKGILQRKTTKQIADDLVQLTRRGAREAARLAGPTVARQLYSQAQALAQTAIQDQLQQIENEFLKRNPWLQENREWEWVAAMDSITCPECGYLDGQRSKERQGLPAKPLHIGCRCDVVLVNPDDPFWNQERNGEEIRPVEEGPYKLNPYKTKVKVHGENFYRHSKEGGRNYPEWLAKTNKWTKHEFLRSWKRVEMFDAAVEKGVNPRKALGDLLKGENGDRRWIPTG